MTREQVERDTGDREIRFDQLRRMGRLASGQREREPLPEGKRDEA